MSDKDTEDKQPFTPLEVTAAIVAFLWFLLTLGVFGGKAISNNAPVPGNGGNVDPAGKDSKSAIDSSSRTEGNQSAASDDHQ